MPGIRINLLRCLAIEIFKCVNGLNPDYLNKKIHKKSSPYELRDTSILSRPKVNYIQYCLKTFSSYGAMGALMSDPEIFCMCVMCIYWYM